MKNIEYKKRLRQVFSTTVKSKKKYWTFCDLIGHHNIRYFSYGRYAFLTALECIGVKKGDKILLPSYICREFLSPINVLQAETVFYDVGEKLTPLQRPGEFPKCKAIVAVNYFGFPQDIDPFYEYCKLTGAVLIEDNAHGLFSRDQNNTCLGVRGDFGIFSFRKTLPLMNGAAVVVNNKKYIPSLEQQIDSKKYHSLNFLGKTILRKLFPLIGIHGMKNFTYAARLIKKAKTGSMIPISDPDAEDNLPPLPYPGTYLLSQLESVDIAEETKRRRELYVWLEDEVRQVKGVSIFDELPDNTVPYVFPFYAGKDAIGHIEKKLHSYGLECFPWPALPNAIERHVPEYYNRIYYVPFIW